MSAQKRKYNITSLQRGLGILQLLGLDGRRLPASEIAKLSGLPVSTVHRFLVNLETGGFLSKDALNNYHLGVACVSLGQAAREQLDIRKVSLTHLEELNHSTRETIHLTVRHKLSAVYIEKLDSPEPLRIHSRIGASVPLYCTAVGKVMLAYLGEEEQGKIINQLELRRFTENTVGSIQELLAQLTRVRKDGFALDLEEHEPHILCIAAPIWDHTGAVNTSLSVTGPAVRMSTPRLRELASLVRAASLKISRELGFSPPANRKSAAVRPAAIRGSKARIVRPVLHARIAAK
ncbi:MAG: IclR family transcriptional regulator [Candidatus Acidiferrales bacterium]